MDVSVIIPVYQSSDSLPWVIERTRKVAIENFISFEIVCVDDGSQDDSWNTIKSLCDQYPEVRGLRLSRNFGQWSATLCGLQHANGRFLLTLDDDGQCNPAYGPQLLSLVKSGHYDVASGVRGDVRSRRLDWIFRIFLGKRHNSSMVALRKEVITQNRKSEIRMGMDAHLRWVAAPHRIAHQIITFGPRIKGKTSYRLKSRMLLILRDFLAYLGSAQLIIFVLIIGIIFGIFFQEFALNVWIGVSLIINVFYISEIFLLQKGKPNYWVMEKYSKN